MTDNIVDVDKTYKPDSGLSLDEHREKELATIEQPRFGGPSPKKTESLPAETSES